MNFIASVFLMLALLDSFHSAPLIGSDGGTYKETETSSSWGYNVGIDGKIGLEGGLKDGQGSLGIYKHFGANVGGHKRNGQKDINHPITLQHTPHYAQQYVAPYAIPYISQYAPQRPLGALQYIPQGVPQYIPQYAQQGAPQYYPQIPPHYVPQGAPENATRKAPQHDTMAAPLDETQ